LTSDLYDHPELYDSLFPVGTHLPFYLDLARRQGGEILELACGTGQLTVPIAREGLSIAGLDSSSAMLNVARGRAVDAQVSVEFVLGDMRRFSLDRHFSMVFVARNSLLHLSSKDDLLAAFSAIRSHLKPKGLLAFDVFNPDVRMLAIPAGRRVPVMRVATESFGELFVETTHDYDSAAQVDRGTWYISAPERRDAWVVPLTIRSIFPQELPLLLSAGGLRLVERFGDLSMGEFRSSSPSQICLCEAAA
jgi:SAM-dependent methyltransferase